MANATDIAARDRRAHLAVVSPLRSVSAYRETMRQLAGGVSIVTVGAAPQRMGFAATSVASLSADPPLLIVSADRAALSLAELERSRCFGVNVLAEHHWALAARFGGHGGAKGEPCFAGACWHPMVTGASLLCDALAAMDCELEETIERRSHTIVIGRVVAARHRGVGNALVSWRGDYHTLARSGDEQGLAQWEPILGSRNVGCG